MRTLLKDEWTLFAVALFLSASTAVLTFTHANHVLTFVVSAISLATLAVMVGQGTEQLGNYLGPGPTGVLQSAIGNLPELFVGFFALQAGLVTVVQSALVGSILANSLLVLGLAFFLGGLKNGIQKFSSETPRVIAILMVLAVSALAIPTLAHTTHTPADAHEVTLSIASAIILLVLFLASIPFSLQSGSMAEVVHPKDEGETVWPLARVIGVLAVGGISAALVS